MEDIETTCQARHVSTSGNIHSCQFYAFHESPSHECVCGFRGGAFRGVTMYLDDMAKKAVVENLRYEFVRLMTVDGPTNDRRRREYNQALFDPETGVRTGRRSTWTWSLRSSTRP